MAVPTVFVSYSHRDEQAKDALLSHLGVLSRQGILDTWDDRRISGGDDWRKGIEASLEAARVAILLVSVDFLNSDFVQNVEIPKLLARHQEKDVRIVPVIIRPCAWKTVSWLRALQARPTDGQPLLGLSPVHQEEAWTELAEEVHSLLQE